MSHTSNQIWFDSIYLEYRRLQGIEINVTKCKHLFASWSPTTEPGLYSTNRGWYTLIHIQQFTAINFALFLWHCSPSAGTFPLHVAPSPWGWFYFWFLCFGVDVPDLFGNCSVGNKTILALMLTYSMHTIGLSWRDVKFIKMSSFIKIPFTALYILLNQVVSVTVCAKMTACFITPAVISCPFMADQLRRLA